MDESELRLDGNAAAGLLAAIFGSEMTLGWSRCDGCGTERELGALVAYVHGMGTILRCPGCDTPQIRIAEISGSYWIDMRGVRTLRIGAT